MPEIKTYSDLFLRIYELLDSHNSRLIFFVHALSPEVTHFHHFICFLEYDFKTVLLRVGVFLVQKFKIRHQIGGDYHKTMIVSYPFSL